MGFYDSFQRQYGHPLGDYYESSEASKVDAMLDEPIESTGATIGEMGTSANPFEHQTKALLARIKEGASRVEFGFMGQGKGNKQSFTPETFGSQERREMRELAKLNEIETSTHASPNIGPLSGLGERGFNDEQREKITGEINKAIDFAGDATTGGAVVFHTGEWQRPMETTFGGKFRKFSSSDYIDDNGKIIPKHEFETLPEPQRQKYRQITEKDRTPFMVVDKESGQVQAISRDQKFDLPVLDNEMSQKTGKDIYKTDEEGKIVFKEMTFDQLVEEQKKNNPGYKKMKDEEIAIRVFLDREYFQNEGESERFSRETNSLKDAYNNLDDDARQVRRSYEESVNQAIENLRRMKREQNQGDITQEEISSIREETKERLGRRASLLTDEGISQEKRELSSQLNSYQQLASSYKQKAEQIRRQMDNMTSIEKYGLSKTADTISNAAVHAINVTKKHKKDLKNDIYVAPESYSAELYGGHPDEIRKIIDESRDALVKKLTKANHYSEDDAKNLAKKHIKGTLDIGHLNMWKQYFVRKDGESQEAHDKRFKKWLINETGKLAKEGYIGHAHISDNFGYDDEHLIAGEGNAPVSDFVKKMREHGVKEFIQEPGSFNYDYALRQTWRNLGVSNFGASYRFSDSQRAVPGRVDQFLNSYMGHTAKPSYVFGRYMPKVPDIEKSWSPWSGTPL